MVNHGRMTMVVHGRPWSISPGDDLSVNRQSEVRQFYRDIMSLEVLDMF